MAAPEHAQRKPERRRRFALAGAGVDDQQALLDRSCRRPRRPAPPCAWPSWRDGARLRPCRSVSLMAHLTACLSARAASPATIEHDAIGARRHALIEHALQIAKLPAERMLRHDPGADFVGDQHDRRRRRRQAPVPAAPISASISASASIRFDSHNVRQSTSTGVVCACRQRRRRVPAAPRRCCHCGPRRARWAAMRSAISSSPRFGGRHIGPRRAGGSAAIKPSA